MDDNKKEGYDVGQQLMILKDVTQRFGQISDVQEHQLKMWSLLYPHTTKSEVKIDMERHIVRMILHSSFRPTKKTKLLSENIERWVRFILWDNTRVIIEKFKINKENKVVFDSEKVTERLLSEEEGEKKEKN